MLLSFGGKFEIVVGFGWDERANWCQRCGPLFLAVWLDRRRSWMLLAPLNKKQIAQDAGNLSLSLSLSLTLITHAQCTQIWSVAENSANDNNVKCRITSIWLAKVTLDIIIRLACFMPSFSAILLSLYYCIIVLLYAIRVDVLRCWDLATQDLGTGEIQYSKLPIALIRNNEIWNTIIWNNK